MDFQTLPLEVRLDIFSYFTTAQLRFIVAPMCANWLQISKQAVLQKALHLQWIFTSFDVDAETKQIEGLKRILGRSPFLRKLTFKTFFKGFEWTSHLTEFSLLRYLSLECCIISSIDTKRLLKLFPNILTLKIEINFEAFDFPLDWITGWKYLRKICIYFGSVNHPDYLPLITKNFEFLEVLHISASRHLHENSLINFLKIRGSKLTELGLGTLDGLTSQSFTALQLCSRLTSLYLTDTANMTNEDLLILKEIKSLRSLRFFETKLLFSDAESILFNEISLPQITELNLMRCNNITNASFLAILKWFPSLTKLALVQLFFMSDESLNEIPKYCRNLKTLYLISTKIISAECLENLLSMPTLEVLKTKWCGEICRNYVYNRPAASRCYFKDYTALRKIGIKSSAHYLLSISSYYNLNVDHFFTV